MLLSVRQCAEPMTQIRILKVKVTLQGHMIYPSICVRSITPKPFERFSLNFTQIFVFVRGCAEHITQLPRLNVTGQGQKIYLLILCPLHFSLALQAIFIKLYPNVPLSVIMCRTYDSAMQTQGQGHTFR